MESIPSAPTEVREFFQPIKVVGACHEWQGSRNQHGYGRFGVSGWSIYVHRLAWLMAYGSIPPGLEVLHRCDNPPCCRLDHLFIGTHADNMADCAAKGRAYVPPETQARGSRQGLSKLTEADVVVIRATYAAGGISRSELARRYRVHTRTIGRVLSRQTWGHV